MTYLLDRGPTQKSQGRDLKDEQNEIEDQDRQAEEEEDVEEEQGERQRIVTNSQHVQSPLYGKLRGKASEKERPNSNRKQCCSTRLASSKKQTVENERFGETEKLGFQLPFSKMRLKNAGGKVLEVQGGRIIRSFGRKDRHSKVCTSKGPRDRRVRLSAHTAIQFYDVQDRLGYDRPSKAIDWLIDKAREAIEALSDFPKQKHTDNSTPKTEEHLGEKSTSTCQLHHHQGCHSEPEKLTRLINNASNLSTAAPTSSFSNQFSDYPAADNSTQGLCVSLQSFKAPVFDLHHSVELESLSDLNATDMGRFQSLVDWNSNASSGREEFVFSSSAESLQHPVLSQNQLFAARGTHEDSNLLSLHPWNDPPISVDGHVHTQSPTSHSIPSTGFFSGGFLGI